MLVGGITGAGQRLAPVPPISHEDITMPSDKHGTSRRAFLKHAAIAAGVVSARGIYGLLDELLSVPLARAAITSATLPNEQYLIDGLDLVTDNGVDVIIPPLYHDIITAQLATGTSATALFREIGRASCRERR